MKRSSGLIKRNQNVRGNEIYHQADFTRLWPYDLYYTR